MHLTTCHHCAHREGCSIKAEKLASLRGLGFTSANFRCAERLSGFEVGRRVTLAFRYPACDPDDPWKFGEPIPGTIYDRRGRKIAIWLDQKTDRGHVVVSVYPDFPGLVVLDERTEWCEGCGAPTTGARGDTWACPVCRPDEVPGEA